MRDDLDLPLTPQRHRLLPVNDFQRFVGCVEKERLLHYATLCHESRRTTQFGTGSRYYDSNVPSSLHRRSCRFDPGVRELRHRLYAAAIPDAGRQAWNDSDPGARGSVSAAGRRESARSAAGSGGATIDAG